MTKKEIKSLYENKKLKYLNEYVIFDGTKKDLIDALYLLFKKGSDEYNIDFESVPYSRGGKWTRHTSTLHSVQSWKIEERDGLYYITTRSTSKSDNCPAVIVPKFYTEKGKKHYNYIIIETIQALEKKLLK